MLTLHQIMRFGEVGNPALIRAGAPTRAVIGKSPTRSFRAGLSNTQMQSVHVFYERPEIRHYWSPKMYEACGGTIRNLTIDMVSTG